MDRNAIVASLLLFFPVAFAVSKLLRSKSNAVPLVGREYGNIRRRRQAYITHAKDLYEKGYKTFKDKVFRLDTNDGSDFQSYTIKHFEGNLHNHRGVLHHTEMHA